MITIKQQLSIVIIQTLKFQLDSIQDIFV